MIEVRGQTLKIQAPDNQNFKPILSDRRQSIKLTV